MATTIGQKRLSPPRSLNMMDDEERQPLLNDRGPSYNADNTKRDEDPPKLPAAQMAQIVCHISMSFGGFSNSMCYYVDYWSISGTVPCRDGRYHCSFVIRVNW